MSGRPRLRRVLLATAGALLLVAAPASASLRAVAVTQSVPLAVTKTVKATCPTGQHVAFGGWRTSSTVSDYTPPQAIAPVGKRVAGWSVVAKGNTPPAAKVTSLAYCAPGPKPTVVRLTGDLQTGTLEVQQLAVVCPAGMKVLGGGFRATTLVYPVDLERQEPLEAWRVRVVNANGGAGKLTAIALCGSGPRPAAVEATTKVAEGAAGSVTATCPAGTTAPFGGLRTTWDTATPITSLPTAMARPKDRSIRVSAIHAPTGPDLTSKADVVAIAYCR